MDGAGGGGGGRTNSFAACLDQTTNNPSLSPLESESHSHSSHTCLGDPNRGRILFEPVLIFQRKKLTGWWRKRSSRLRGRQDKSESRTHTFGQLSTCRNMPITDVPPGYKTPFSGTVRSSGQNFFRQNDEYESNIKFGQERSERMQHQAVYNPTASYPT